MGSQTFFRIAFLALLLYCPAMGQKGSIPEGFKPYTPTRIEWLELIFNSKLRTELTVESQYSIDFYAASADTMVMAVTYLPNVDRKAMNITLDSARYVVAKEVEGKGWSSWFKLKERIEMGKVKAEK
jgi:hypothetical protein